MKATVDRFVRVVGGQVLGVAITSTISFITGNGFDPQYAYIGTVLGAALTALDKFLRDKGVYGSSLERTTNA